MIKFPIKYDGVSLWYDGRCGIIAKNTGDEVVMKVEKFHEIIDAVNALTERKCACQDQQVYKSENQDLQSGDFGSLLAELHLEASQVGGHFTRDSIDLSHKQQIIVDEAADNWGRLCGRAADAIEQLQQERDRLQVEADSWVGRVSELVSWATNGLLSKPNTAQCYIEDYHEERVLEPRVKEATAEITSERDACCEKLAAIKEFCDDMLRISDNRYSLEQKLVLYDILGIIGSKERSNE